MKTNIFFQKRFWKAAGINLMLAILLMIAITAYFTAIKYSEGRLGTTALAKLNITAPEQLLEHSEEIMQAPATITRIYFEWLIETIIFYLLTTVLYTTLYSTALSILLNNKLQGFKKFKSVLKQNLIIFAILFIVFATITLTAKTSLVAPTLQIMFIAFATITMLISASQLYSKTKVNEQELSSRNKRTTSKIVQEHMSFAITKQGTLIENIMHAAKAIIPFIKKSIIGTLVFATLIALTIMFITPTALFYNPSALMQATAIITILTLLYITWLSSKTLEAVR